MQSSIILLTLLLALVLTNNVFADWDSSTSCAQENSQTTPTKVAFRFTKATSRSVECKVCSGILCIITFASKTYSSISSSSVYVLPQNSDLNPNTDYYLYCKEDGWFGQSTGIFVKTRPKMPSISLGDNGPTYTWVSWENTAVESKVCINTVPTRCQDFAYWYLVLFDSLISAQQYTISVYTKNAIGQSPTATSSFVSKLA